MASSYGVVQRMGGVATIQRLRWKRAGDGGRDSKPGSWLARDAVHRDPRRSAWFGSNRRSPFRVRTPRVALFPRPTGVFPFSTATQGSPFGPNRTGEASVWAGRNPEGPPPGPLNRDHSRERPSTIGLPDVRGSHGPRSSRSIRTASRMCASMVASIHERALVSLVSSEWVIACSLPTSTLPRRVTW